jgi:hypothetical protein
VAVGFGGHTRPRRDNPVRKLLFGFVAALFGVMVATAPAATAGPIPELAAVTVNANGWYVTCNHLGTMVRSSPGGPVHTVLPNGTRVHVRAIHNGAWAAIDYPVHGWVPVIDLCRP